MWIFQRWIELEKNVMPLEDQNDGAKQHQDGRESEQNNMTFWYPLIGML